MEIHKISKSILLNRQRLNVGAYLNNRGELVFSRIFNSFPGISKAFLKSEKIFACLICLVPLIVIPVWLLHNQFNKVRDQLSLFPSIGADTASEANTAKVVQLAEAFKATLNTEQAALLQLQYSKENAVRWSNFPQAFSQPNRVGLGLKALNPAQLAAAKKLMANVLAKAPLNEGYDELEGVLAADDLIAKTTGKTDAFGSGNFYIAFLGEPSTTKLWELQFGGHHFAFANTYNHGEITGVTPSFRGVEPMAPVTSNGRTYQPIEQERKACAEMIEALTDAEKKSARLAGTFSNILLGPGNDGQFPNNKQGLKIGELSAGQQKKIITVIELYVNDVDSETAKSYMTKYLAELPDTYISFSGSGTMNETSDYVRLDGPNIWIEYSGQPSRDIPGTAHAHSVWRDRKTDYGGN